MPAGKLELDIRVPIEDIGLTTNSMEVCQTPYALVMAMVNNPDWFRRVMLSVSKVNKDLSASFAEEADYSLSGWLRNIQAYREKTDSQQTVSALKDVFSFFKRINFVGRKPGEQIEEGVFIQLESILLQMIGTGAELTRDNLIALAKEKSQKEMKLNLEPASQSIGELFVADFVKGMNAIFDREVMIPQRDISQFVDFLTRFGNQFDIEMLVQANRDWLLRLNQTNIFEIIDALSANIQKVVYFAQALLDKKILVSDDIQLLLNMHPNIVCDVFGIKLIKGVMIGISPNTEIRAKFVKALAGALSKAGQVSPDIRALQETLPLALYRQSLIDESKITLDSFVEKYA